MLSQLTATPHWRPDTVSGALMSLLQKHGGVYWPMQESSGSVALARNTALAEGRNICTNGGFDADATWVKGTNWTISDGVATHAAGSAGIIDQNLVGYLRATATYRVTCVVTRTAGSLQVVLGGTAAGLITSSGSYSFDVVCGAANTRLQFSADSAFAGTLDSVTLSRLNIAANDVNLNGTYTNVTLGQQAGRLGLAGSYASAASQTNIFSPELNSMFNPNAGTALIFGKVSDAGVWADGAVRQLFSVYMGTANRVYIYKMVDVNKLYAYVSFGSSFSAKGSQITTTTTNWFLVAVTWDRVNDVARAYFNGAQVGADATGIPLCTAQFGSTTTNLGCFSASSSPWSGLLTGAAFLRGAASAAEIAQLARIAGVV